MLKTITVTVKLTNVPERPLEDALTDLRKIYPEVESIENCSFDFQELGPELVSRLLAIIQTCQVMIETRNKSIQRETEIRKSKLN